MESNVVAERVESENPIAKEVVKNEQTIICAGENDGNIENSKNPVTATESPKAKEETKNEDTTIGAVESNGNIDNIKDPVTVSVIATESPEDKEEAKNDETIIAALVASATAEVASITISPEKKVESLHHEINSVKNDKKKIRKEVQVSNSKKPFVYYLSRAKRFINEFNEVELCGLGMAIPTVVTIAEILKRNGFAIQKGIMTSTVFSTQEDRKGRQIEKAKIEIVLQKAEKLDAINGFVTPKKSADLDDAWN